jgi:hypothetical protein
MDLRSPDGVRRLDRVWSCVVPRLNKLSSGQCGIRTVPVPVSVVVVFAVPVVVVFFALSGPLPPPAAGVDGRGEKRFKAVIRRAEGLFVKNNHTFIDQYQGRDEIDAEINAHGIQKQGANSILVRRASGVCSLLLDMAGRDAA